MSEIQTAPYRDQIEKIIMAKDRTTDEQEELDLWLENCSEDEWEWYLDFAKQRQLALTRKRPADFAKNGSILEKG